MRHDQKRVHPAGPKPSASGLRLVASVPAPDRCVCEVSTQLPGETIILLDAVGPGGSGRET